MDMDMDKDMDMAAHERMWQVNYHGTIHTCRAFGRQMMARRRGAIVTWVPSDVADAIAFLCSEEAKAITGVLPLLDAGWLAAVSYRTYAGGVPWTE
jgi:NAD(P)-dependent dehydrogenase (short-subunit alcohol dehydrogenase family)